MSNLDEILQMTDDLTDEELNSLIQELTKRYLDRVRQNTRAESEKLAARLEQLQVQPEKQRQLEALRQIRNTVD